MDSPIADLDHTLSKAKMAVKRGRIGGADIKVTLDLSRLLEEGKLSPAEAERLRALAADDTGSSAINILVGFGIVAVSGGAVALVPTPLTALILGLVVFAIGLGFTLRGEAAMEPACANLSRGRRADVLRRCARNRQGCACRDADRHRRTRRQPRSSRDRACSWSRRCSRSAPVSAPAPAIGTRPICSPIYEPLVTIVLFGLLALGTYYLSKSLAGRLRATGADCGADVCLHGQFRLLGRLALGR